uniref:CBM39 domain-containing protein n=1 Tax=Glossina palpalis gambiensis TaxID=67801 RepID=A0A1B0BNW5_9MUSC
MKRMVRVLLVVTILLCICCIHSASAQARTVVNRYPTRATRTRPTAVTAATTQATNSPISESLENDDNDPNNEDIDGRQYNYHPIDVKEPYVLEQSDRRFKDGTYEYRFLLNNGVARYEKSYWEGTGNDTSLARKGYYSHPLKNGKFLTIYYTADRDGYREDLSTYTDASPVLPRSLEIPENDDVVETSTNPINLWSVTRKPKTKTRKPKTLNENDLMPDDVSLLPSTTLPSSLSIEEAL